MRFLNKTMIGPLFSVFFTVVVKGQNGKDPIISKTQVAADSVSDEQLTHKRELGIGGGIVVYRGDLAPTFQGAYRLPMTGIQIDYTDLFSQDFALRVGAVLGHFGANEVKSAVNQSYRDHRRYNFTTSFAEISILTQWSPFAKANWRLAPYLMGGAGASFLKVKNDWSKTDFSYFPEDNLQQSLEEDSAQKHAFATFVLPVGLGLKYNASSRVALRLEWINHTTFSPQSDYLDGFSMSANPKNKDHYTSLMLSLSFALGKNKHSGNDSKYVVADDNYYNNNIYKKDSSTVTSRTQNKPADKLEQKTDIEAVKQEYQHKLDSLTKALNEAKLNTDKINDSASSNFSLLDKSIIYFGFDHSYLEGNSFDKLDNIISIMKADPKLKVRFRGFTDMKGSYEYNMKLSLDRAAICKDYLKAHGINANRIITEAFGKTKYIVGEFDPDQQWRNRRVEVYFN